MNAFERMLSTLAGDDVLVLRQVVGGFVVDIQYREHPH